MKKKLFVQALVYDPELVGTLVGYFFLHKQDMGLRTYVGIGTHMLSLLFIV